MKALNGAGFLVVAFCTAAAHASVLFDFNSAPLHASLPLDLTVNGITAHFSATGQGFSIQDPASSIGLVPAGFSGYCLVPNSINSSDLLISFPTTTLTAFSILYAPQELATDSSATMRVTAYMNGTLVGTNTAVANPPGTWPSATLSISVPQGFNSVVVHYDSPPPTGGDYGTIFVADNMIVTAAPVVPGLPPFYGFLLFFALIGTGTLAVERRRRAQRRQAALPRV